MRRLLAALIVVSLACAPVLNVWCTSSAAVPAVPGTSGGHGEQSPSGPAIASAHDCLAHVQAPALAEKLASGLRVVMAETAPCDLDRDRRDLMSTPASRANHYGTTSPPR